MSGGNVVRCENSVSDRICVTPVGESTRHRWWALSHSTPRRLTRATDGRTARSHPRSSVLARYRALHPQTLSRGVIAASLGARRDHRRRPPGSRGLSRRDSSQRWARTPMRLRPSRRGCHPPLFMPSSRLAGEGPYPNATSSDRPACPSSTTPALQLTKRWWCHRCSMQVVSGG